MSKKVNECTGLEIAIVGMSCRLPGANNIEELWNILSEGKNTISFFSDEELRESGVEEKYIKDKNYIRARGILRNAEYFDSSFFSYTSDEAEVMDPQTRILHECVWESLEDAGYDPFEYSGIIGLYTGASTNLDWLSRAYLCKDMAVDDFSKSFLSNKEFGSSLISYKLNLKGPSVHVSAACSTSLVALHMACQALLAGECNLAVAGAASIVLPEKVGYLYNENMVDSPDGYCRAFDEDAKGTLFSNGAAVMVLKPLEDAIKDHDNVYAIIKGSAINNDGNRKVGYTAPSSMGQAEVIRQALQAAQLSPETISYVEPHGAGTIVGDPIEIEALTKAYNTEKRGYCGIGSIKTNMGHLDVAAGIAGCMKTVLAMKNNLMPPSLNFKKANSKIDFKNSPFYVNAELKKWEDSTQPIRAGVSSCGVGGENAHVILEESVNETKLSTGRKYKLVLVSGKNKNVVEKASYNLANHIEKNPEIDIDNLAYTLSTGRRRFDYRKMFVCSSRDDIIEALTNDSESIVKEYRECGAAKKHIVFMFPGQGSQYVGMGRGLYESEPVFRKVVDHCSSILEKYLNLNVADFLYYNTDVEAGDKLLEQTKMAQPFMFCMEYGLAQLMMSWGIYPEAMIGHSLGEYVAACIAGVYSLEDGLRIMATRAAMMESMPEGKMVSVEISYDELNKYLNSKVDVVAINSVTKCVISGKLEDIMPVVEALERDGYHTLILKSTHACHSYLMEPILEDFKNMMKNTKLHAPSVAYISCVTGTWATAEEVTNPEYWANHLRRTVQFNKGLSTLLKTANSIFIEAGPGRSLGSFVNQHVNKQETHQTVSLMRRSKDDVEDENYILNALGKLWLYGAKIDWNKYYSNEVRYKISLPTYAFERRKYDLLIRKGNNVQLVNGEVEQSISQAETTAQPIMTKIDDVNELTTQMVAVWKDYFGLDELSMSDDFYDLGGDSLRAMSFIGKVNQIFHTNITISSFLKKPTIKSMINLIANKNKEDIMEISKCQKREYYPLSPSQRRIYILSQLSNVGTSYNIPFALKIYGKLDRERVQAAIQKLCERHEALRTVFTLINDQPVQMIQEHVTCDTECYQSNLNQVNEIIERFIRCFDVSKAPLFRVGLIEIDDSQCIFLFDVHHIIADAVSISVLIRDFAQLYKGEILPDNKYQYVDYAVWKSKILKSEKMEQEREFWMNELKDSNSNINLPYDYEKHNEMTFIGDILEFELTESITEQLKRICKEFNITMFVTLFSFYNIMLSKLSGQDDINVGTIISGRVHPDLESIIGVFINMLVIRTYPTNDKTFSEYMKEVREKVLKAFDNQEYEFDDLAEDLNIKRDGSNNPLFNVIFDWQNVDYGTLDIEGYQTESYDCQQKVSQFDIHFTGYEKKDKICFGIEYNTDLFTSKTIEKIRDYYIEVMETVFLAKDTKLGNIQLNCSLQEAQTEMNLDDLGFDF